MILREPVFLSATPRSWPPGVESIIDYNNSAVVMNDLRRADRIVVTSVSGLSGPDLQASAEKNPDRDGEQMLDATYGGRTITLRGYVESGNRDRMRALYSYLLDGFDDVSAEAALWFRWMDWRDPFVDSLALVDYTYDAGSGTLQIASDGSGLQPTTTANKQIVVAPTKSDGTVPTRFGYGEAEAIIKFRAGTALTGLAVGPELRRSSSAVKLRVLYEKATDTIRLYKVNTSVTQLASIAATGLVVGTDYWLLARAEGVVVTFSLWSTYPVDVGGTPLFSGSYTLTGGDITLYPSSTTGLGSGLYWTPNSTTDRVSLLDVGALNPGDPVVFCRKAVQIEGEETQVDYQWRREFLLTLRASSALMISRKVTTVTFSPPSTPTNQLYYSTTISNLGRSPAEMRVTFSPDQHNTRMWVASTGETLALNALVSNSNAEGVKTFTSMRADTNTRTLTDLTNLPTLAYDALSDKTTWPRLQRGSNEIRVVMDRMDNFTDANVSFGAVLNGYNASTSKGLVTSPGTWATSGATTDFTNFQGLYLYLSDPASPTNVGDPYTRTTTADTASGSGRVALAGATTYTDARIRIAFQASAFPALGSPFTSTSRMEFGVIARYVDANNFFRVGVSNEGGNLWARGILRVAGVETNPGSQSLGPWAGKYVKANTWYYLDVDIRANGRFGIYLIDPYTNSVLLTSDYSFSGSTTETSAIDTAINYSLQSSVLATAGALATGKVGFFDKNASGSASSRYYTYFTITSAANSGTIAVAYRHSSR